MTNKNDCEKSSCGCPEGEQKIRLHVELMNVWDKLPDNIKEMVHSLATQKVAVLKEIKTWADANKDKNLSAVCERKIEKTNHKLEDYK